jgi:hypothetical protein
LEIEHGRRVRLTISSPSMSRLSRQCETSVFHTPMGLNSLLQGHLYSYFRYEGVQKIHGKKGTRHSITADVRQWLVEYFFVPHCHSPCNFFILPRPSIILHTLALNMVAARPSETSLFCYKTTWRNLYLTSLLESQDRSACNLPVLCSLFLILYNSIQHVLLKRRYFLIGLHGVTTQKETVQTIIVTTKFKTCYL